MIVFNIIANLIAFIAFVYFINGILGWMGGLCGKFNLFILNSFSILF